LKAVRHKKVLGIAIGEKSLQVAELHRGLPSSVTAVAEMLFPVGASIDTPAELGAALGGFLKEKGFTASHAVIGLPARWLLIRQKEVPAADTETRIEMLRLAAEVEFSTGEFSDVVYDYADNRDPASAHPVMLVATPQKYITAVNAMCSAAKLTALAVLPSSIALGEMTSRKMNDEALVLTASSSGSELVASREHGPIAIKSMRGSDVQQAFVSELRRTIMGLPKSPNRDMVLWDSGSVDPVTLGQSLGYKVTRGELSSLGLATESLNGSSQRFAPAVAVAMSVLGGDEPLIDFLHSRLTLPKPKLIPVVISPVTVILPAVSTATPAA